jgi:hypothetical protein
MNKSAMVLECRGALLLSRTEKGARKYCVSARKGSMAGV